MTNNEAIETSTMTNAENRSRGSSTTTTHSNNNSNSSSSMRDQNKTRNSSTSKRKRTSHSSTSTSTTTASTSTNGKPVTLASLQANLTLLDFGPCPSMVAMIKHSHNNFNHSQPLSSSSSTAAAASSNRNLVVQTQFGARLNAVSTADANTVMLSFGFNLCTHVHNLLLDVCKLMCHRMPITRPLSKWLASSRHQQTKALQVGPKDSVGNFVFNFSMVNGDW